MSRELHPEIEAVLAGRRRWALVQADCLSVLPTLPAGCASLVLADPPYGIGLEVHSHNRDKWGKDWSMEGDGDSRVGQEMVNWAFGQSLPIVAFASPRKPWIGDWDQLLVWDKGPAVGGGGNKNTRWKPTWELIQVAGTGELNGQRDGAVLKYWVSPNFRKDFEHHMCQKPIPLLRYLIEKTSRPGVVVLDPSAGSGSIGVAALESDRRFIGIEIDPHYCEIARRRLERAEAEVTNEAAFFAGKASQGQLFEEGK